LPCLGVPLSQVAVNDACACNCVCVAVCMSLSVCVCKCAFANVYLACQIRRITAKGAICKDCEGVSICPHNKCKDCGGASICAPRRQRSNSEDFERRQAELAAAGM